MRRARLRSHDLEAPRRAVARRRGRRDPRFGVEQRDVRERRPRHEGHRPRRRRRHLRQGRLQAPGHRPSSSRPDGRGTGRRDDRPSAADEGQHVVRIADRRHRGTQDADGRTGAAGRRRGREESPEAPDPARSLAAAGQADAARRAPRADRRLGAEDPRDRPRGDPAARRQEGTGPAHRSGQTRRRIVARRAAVDRPSGRAGQDRHPLRQRGRGHALCCGRVDPHATGSVGDLRSARRQLGRGARGAVRRQRDDDAPVQRRGPPVLHRVRRHRRHRHRARTVRDPDSARGRGSQQLPTVFRAGAGRANCRVARRAEAGRREAARVRAVQRHPRLHGAVRDDEPGRHGASAHGVLHRDGGVRVQRRRHARQVHRRRGDGAVGRADRRRRRSGQGDGGRRSR